MPRNVQVIDDEIWKSRIASANSYYQKWEGLFKCKILEKYYEGFQWKDVANDDYRAYTINKIYETIQIKLDAFIPQFPRFTVAPRAGSSDFDLETAATSSQLKEDVLNTIVADERETFAEEMRMAYKDSFSRFGIVEVGYSADWVINPNAPRPLLNTDVVKDPGQPKIKNEPQELPQNERVYFKHVAAARFRVGGIDHKYLHRCGWYGYYEWVDRNDLLALRGIWNRSKLDYGSSSESGSSVGDQQVNLHNKGSAYKLWHLWDNKAKVYILYAEDCGCTIWQRPFTRQCIFDYRPDPSLISEGFYPIPPMWHWISAQDEVNETREQLRAHRRRFIRKYQILEGGVDDDNITKFETGGDGSLIVVKRENAITPIGDAPLGNGINQSIVTSGDDLNQISGTSAEVRGEADRTTATQANIISQRSGLREDAERDRIANWAIKIGRETLLIVREKFTLGVWANLTADNKTSLFTEMQANKEAYTWVSSEDLNDGYDFRVEVDVTTLSSQTKQIAKQAFLEFLSLTTQFPQIAMSPKLIREAAYRVGYRDEAIIKEMMNMAMLQQMATMHGIGQQMQGGQPQGAQTAQQINQKNTPPQQEQIRNQLQNQLGTTQ